MKGNKGFTLVELLAIIVILGIIAVITTPVILGVIDDARKDAAVDKSWGTINAIKLAYAQEQNKMSGTAIDTDDVDITGFILGSTKIRISGDKPTAGTFTIDSDGNVFIKNMTFDGYKCNYKKSGATDDTPATVPADADYTKIICTK